LRRAAATKQSSFLFPDVKAGLFRLARNDGYNGLPLTSAMSGQSSMVENRLDRSRRKLICAVAKGVSAGLLFRVSQTEASEKMTPQQAEYQDTPNGIYSCAMCTLFESPKSCKVVAGEVSKDGWCKAFALAD
jgi:hypothetical protein